MTILDWWSTEISIFIAGRFGVIDQASQIVLVNITLIFYYMSSGIGVASSTIIGQQIGKGDVKQAQEFYKVIKFNSVVMIGHLCVILYMFKYQILLAITSIDSVI